MSSLIRSLNICLPSYMIRVPDHYAPSGQAVYALVVLALLDALQTKMVNIWLAYSPHSLMRGLTSSKWLGEHFIQYKWLDQCNT